MSEPSLRTRIYEKLRIRAMGTDDPWVFGGVIERWAGDIGYKASNASRRLRELTEDGYIERREVQVEGKGPFVVQYKYKEQ